jgi:threonyl-tRNA synthetase
MKKIEKIRHSLAHILASAALKLDPQAKLGIGPTTENGFYYDILFSFKIDESYLKKLEEMMRKIIKENLTFKGQKLTFEEAEKIFKNQPFKLELINDLRTYGTTDFNEIKLIKEKKKKRKDIKKVTVYWTGDFFDLCRGGHVKNTKEINSEAFKLIKIAGAYWRGDEKNPMLTRIYGIAFETKEELENYLKIQQEAEKRDHRVLGQKLELFLFDEEVGQGLPLWTPRGALIRKLIQDFLFEELKNQGYQWVNTPHIGNLNLWKTSGHWELYRENMYSPIKIDEEEYIIKPMNCPFHTKIYKSKIRSYKELPLRFAEFGTVYRYERSGTLHGLTRVRGFTQDDAHIWCTPNQLAGEVERLLKHGLKILRAFGFSEFNVYLATRPEKFAGTEKMWRKAMAVLKYVLKKQKIKYQEDPGGGVFYGPKIDIKIKDVLGREWQCTTIQIDFNLPERFDLSYIDERGKKKRPIMIHRAFLGSIERFIGVLLENTGGALPLWLAPEQIWVIPVGKKHEKYAKEIVDELISCELRVKLKNENETVSKKIREGEIQKIPYMVVIGDKEKEKKNLRVRERGKGDIGEMKLENFIEKLKKEIERKK